MIYGKELVLSFHSTHMHILITLVWFDFFHGSAFWLYNLWSASNAHSFILSLSFTKTPLVGQEKGFIALVRKYSLSDSRESFEELCLAFKNLLRETSRWIADLWKKRNIALCTVLTLNSSRQGEGYKPLGWVQDKCNTLT